jgi:hypothetical protein
MKKYKRNCPKCNKNIFYNYLGNWQNAERLKSKCKNCADKGNKSGSKNYIQILNRLYKNKVFNNLKIKKIIKDPNASRSLALLQCNCLSRPFYAIFTEVKRGNLKGCKKCKGIRISESKSLPNKQGHKNSTYQQIKRAAKSRNIPFMLTRDFVISLIEKPCYYCGNPHSNKTSKTHNKKDTWPHNGIDRKNPTRGYTINNVVSCCKLCNQSKWTMTENKFYKHIKKIIEFSSR